MYFETPQAMQESEQTGVLASANGSRDAVGQHVVRADEPRSLGYKDLVGCVATGVRKTSCIVWHGCPYDTGFHQ